ncbi:hypothetical protein MMC10_001364 [Thelotrema lepadinum]|nr:hypothetical protein [Thelotrema lepadinum]
MLFVRVPGKQLEREGEAEKNHRYRPDETFEVIGEEVQERFSGGNAYRSTGTWEFQSVDYDAWCGQDVNGEIRKAGSLVRML